MLNTEDIQTISNTVCKDMLGLDFEPSDPDSLALMSMVASISIMGDYDAMIEVAMSPQAAHEVTMAMCGLSPDEIQDADIADAIGEIVNIIGGNIKGAMPGGTRLSLPCVSLHCSGSLDVNGTTAFFRLAGEPFSVTLMEYA